MFITNLRIRAKEVEILPVSNSRLELNSQQMCEAEYRHALALGVSMDLIGLHVGRVFLNEVQDVVPLP